MPKVPQILVGAVKKTSKKKRKKKTKQPPLLIFNQLYIIVIFPLVSGRRDDALFSILSNVLRCMLTFWKGFNHNITLMYLMRFNDSDHTADTDLCNT